MGSRVEEYLRRMRERGYQDSLMGMDDEDIEWELSKMEEADRRREAQQQQPLRTIYRPVDPGLKARILRMFGQPHDESAIPEGQKFYLNGWDNGDGEDYAAPAMKTAQNYFVPTSGQARQDDWRDGGNSASGGTAAGVTRNQDWGDGGNSAWRVNTPTGNQNASGYTNGAKQYVTADQLKAFGWQNVDDNMVKDLNDALEKYEITKPARIRHFLAQAAKESGKGQWTTELGDDNYLQYLEGREDLGNVNKGDGPKFKGAGYIQVTGRNNYTDFAKEVNDDDVINIGAEHVAKKYPWMASAYWWSKLNNMNDMVDEFNDLDSDADVERVTKRVNGTPNWSNAEKVKEWEKSLKERQEHYKKSKEIFGY
jgi:predicted chitinase